MKCVLLVLGSAIILTVSLLVAIAWVLACDSAETHGVKTTKTDNRVFWPCLFLAIVGSIVLLHRLLSF